MKKSSYLIFSIIASTYTSKACADDTWYIGGFYTAQDLSTYNRDYNAVGVTIGYQFNDFFALETRLSKGTSDFTSSYDSGSISSFLRESISEQASLLIKGTYPVSESFNFYGVAGYTSIKLKRDGYIQQYDMYGRERDKLILRPTRKGNAITYGVGLNYHLTKQLNVFIDYSKIPDFEFFSGSPISWDITSVGMNYYF